MTTLAETVACTPPRVGDRCVPNPYDACDIMSVQYTPQESLDRAQAIVQSDLDVCYQRRFVTTSENVRDLDKSVYTGLGGIAFTYLKLALHSISASGNNNNNNHNAKEYLQRARDVALTCLEDRDYGKDTTTVSFFVGAPGCLAIACVATALLNEQDLSSLLWNKLLSFQKTALSCQDDELLFGRAGYLYALLFVKLTLEKVALVGTTNNTTPVFSPIHKGNRGILDRVLTHVAEKIVATGRIHSLTDNHYRDGWALMFYFSNDPYLGAAHGMVGILKMLYHCWEYLPCQSQQFVQQTTVRLLQCRFSDTYNLPSVLHYHYDDDDNENNENDNDDNENDDTSLDRDYLVHWCHGSPGVAALCATAMATISNNDKNDKHDEITQLLLEAALQAGDDVWKRGVVLKGNGLCHGVTGNAYTFLTLYRWTNDPIQYQRAKAFAHLVDHSALQQFMSQQPDDQRRVPGQPDSPQSLMEGSSGLVCFFLDLAHPALAAFPGWEF